MLRIHTFLILRKSLFKGTMKKIEKNMQIDNNQKFKISNIFGKALAIFAEIITFKV